tara:strand:- start:8424 stop:8753 length:330 start_codon:yes stop_codon:yes gene_type:complete
MKLEEFKAAIKGQKTIIISHWVGGSLESNKVMRNRTIEVSDLRVLPENGLVAYTFYTHLNDSEHLGNCADVLIRVADVTEVRSVCSLAQWNAGCDAFDAVHDAVGLQGM